MISHIEDERVFYRSRSFRPLKQNSVRIKTTEGPIVDRAGNSRNDSAVCPAVITERELPIFRPLESLVYNVHAFHVTALVDSYGTFMVNGRSRGDIRGAV